MTRLITFDPGNTTGWAVFVAGTLDRAGYGSWAEVFSNPPERRFAGPNHILGELPCVYPGPRPQDPNDLIRVAEQLGELLGVYRSHGCTVETVHPRTWKGSVPKEHHQPRILSKLTVEELALIPLTPRSKKRQPDCVDAVGLGLWKLGRMHG